MNRIETIVKSTEGEVRALLENLVHTCAEQSQRIRMLDAHNQTLTKSYRALCKEKFTASSEQLKNYAIPEQLLLEVFNEFELTALEIEPGEEPKIDPPAAGVDRKKKAGRKPLPPALPRIRIEHDLSDLEKQCDCGALMQCIGTEQSEQLHYVPAKIEILEHHTKKYSCAACAKAHQAHPEIKVPFKTAEKPPQIIPKSMATPSLLAYIVVAKFCDHMPLYRLEQYFQRLAIRLSRQVMSEWAIKLGHAVIPLVNLLQDRFLTYDIGFADETPLQVLHEPGRPATRKSYMWLFIGGPPDQRVLIYQYHPSRSGEVPESFLAGYQGGLHCDGYSAYTRLFAHPSCIIGINCWAHVRRKFLAALPAGKPASPTGVTARVLAYITALYAIERALRDQQADVATIRAVRQAKSKPILDKLKATLDAKQPQVPPQSALGKAIAYTLKRWPYLITYLEDGRFEIDNNRAERGIKPFVMGRKAWLFANRVAGAEASCRLFSLVETAKANGLNPHRYLEHVFKELPHCRTLAHYEKLLPWAIEDPSCRIIDTK